MSSIPRKLGAFFYRDMLSSQGQVFYDCILGHFLQKDYSERILLPVISSNTASSDCFAAYNAVRDDHPECFYLGPQCELICTGEQMTLKCQLLYSHQQILRLQLQLRKLIRRLMSRTADLSRVEQEQLVYRRIAKKLSYVNNQDFSDHNVVGPLLNSAGVCEGYNALLMLCLRRLGIPCVKVYGKSERDVWHCWSMVWIGHTPVHCDVTWDAPCLGTVLFRYFNLSDQQLSKDHFEFRSDFLPECPTDTLNYHFLQGCRFATSKAFLDYIRARIHDQANMPIFAQFSFASQTEDIRSAVETALHACTGRPDVRIHVDEGNQTAVIFAG